MVDDSEVYADLLYLSNVALVLNFKLHSSPAIAQYLGKTDPSSIKGAIASLEDRVADLERQLTGLGKLVG